VQSALESALAELALGPELDPSDLRAVRNWLERHQVTAEDAESMLSRGVERLFVYRRLIRETLRDAMLLAIPRSIARLGPVFDRYFDRFLAERAPQSHYLRDVTREFIDFCEPLWKRDVDVPGYLLDLARHESLRIEVGSLGAGAATSEARELELERGVRFIEAARLVEYAHAVHQLSDDEADRQLPQMRPTWLFVYRSPEHEVRYLELTPLAADILARLMNQGKRLRSALVEACACRGVPLDDAVVQGTARVLADLAERGALLGADLDARGDGDA
jgi:hypothetical protein